MLLRRALPPLHHAPVDWAAHITDWLLTMALGITLLECLPAGQWGLPRRDFDAASFAIAYVLGSASLSATSAAPLWILLGCLCIVWFLIWRVSPLGIAPRQTYQSPPTTIGFRYLLIGVTVAVGLLTWSRTAILAPSGWQAMAAVLLLDFALHWRGASIRQRSISLLLSIGVAAVPDLWPSSHLHLLVIAAVASGCVWRTRVDRRAMWTFMILTALLCSRSSTAPAGLAVALLFTAATPAPAVRGFGITAALAAILGLVVGLANGDGAGFGTSEALAMAWSQLPLTVWGLSLLAVAMRMWAAFNRSQLVEDPRWYHDPALWLMLVAFASLHLWELPAIAWLLIWCITSGTWRVHESTK